ncbi:hypothetical protein FRB90_011850 [Tulasnella sp. 427]|nr:hypothetical protein FRB90_011850 [Tulasnella sp. 427]
MAQNKNVNPFKSDLDFYTLPWDTKIVVLRQLVEWQLSHNATFRNWLDRAHGVVRGGHRKRSDDQPRPTLVPPDPEHTKDKLDYKPLGQDIARKRYWIVDAIRTPPVRQGKRRSKLESGHDELIRKLEERLPDIDAEAKRLEILEERLRVAREKALEEEAKQRAREIQEAQNGTRETRTRGKAAKPEYVYRPPPEDGVVYDDGEEVDELDDDEYRDEPEPVIAEVAPPVQDEEEEYQLDDEEEEEEPAPKANGKKKAQAKAEPKPRPSAVSDPSLRRSGRATQKRSYAEDESSASASAPAPARGERRSSRRQTITSRQEQDEDSDARPTKRSRMSSVGSSNAETSTSGPAQASAAIASISLDGTGTSQSSKTLRPGEKAIETVPGKKRSKFWYYVVEDAADEADAPQPTENEAEGGTMEVDEHHEASGPSMNGTSNGTHGPSAKPTSGRTRSAVASAS